MIEWQPCRVNIEEIGPEFKDEIRAEGWVNGSREEVWPLRGSPEEIDCGPCRSLGQRCPVVLVHHKGD